MLYWMGTIRCPPPMRAISSTETFNPMIEERALRTSFLICSWLFFLSALGFRLMNMTPLLISSVVPVPRA